MKNWSKSPDKFGKKVKCQFEPIFLVGQICFIIFLCTNCARVGSKTIYLEGIEPTGGCHVLTLQTSRSPRIPALLRVHNRFKKSDLMNE